MYLCVWLNTKDADMVKVLVSGDFIKFAVCCFDAANNVVIVCSVGCHVYCELYGV